MLCDFTKHSDRKEWQVLASVFTAFFSLVWAGKFRWRTSEPY